MLFEWYYTTIVFQVDITIWHLLVLCHYLDSSRKWHPFFCGFLLLLHSSSNFRASGGFIGLPNHISESFGCQLRGQNCYVEVTLGFPRSRSITTMHSVANSNGNASKHQVMEPHSMRKSDHTGTLDDLSIYEKTFIYPAEAVLVPILQTSFTRSSLKRYYIYEWNLSYNIINM